MRLRNMLKVCLAFWKSEPQYAYKRYAYKKTFTFDVVSIKVNVHRIFLTHYRFLLFFCYFFKGPFNKEATLKITFFNPKPPMSCFVTINQFLLPPYPIRYITISVRN